MTNIAVVAGYVYPADFAKAERDLRLLQAYQAYLGTIVVVVQSPDGIGHIWESNGIIVHYVPRRGPGVLGLLPFWVKGVLSTWRLVRRHRLVTADASDLSAAFVLIPVKWLTGVRLLLHLQFQFFEMSPLAFPRWKRWAFRVGARVACRFADSIRCVTEDIRRQALRAGVQHEKLTVIPTRCDTALFNPERVRSRPPGTEHTLTYVGSLTKLKGLDVLFAALPQIVDRFPDARLRLVGSGPAQEALENHVARTGLSSTVEFAGPLPYSAIPEVLGSSDLFVYPSYSEAMPRAVLEAMAMARPVVASRVGGIPEMIRDNIEGLLVAPGDVRALADAVCRILGDVTLARSFGNSGRKRVLERFSFQENVRALVDWHLAWAPGSGRDGEGAHS